MAANRGGGGGQTSPRQPSHFRIVVASRAGPFKNTGEITTRQRKRAIEKERAELLAKRRRKKNKRTSLTSEKKKSILKAEGRVFFFSLALSQSSARAIPQRHRNFKKRSSTSFLFSLFLFPIICVLSPSPPSGREAPSVAPHSNHARSRKSRIESARKLSESKTRPLSIEMTSRPSSRLASAKAAAATAAAAAPAAFEYDDELTEYERERLAKIEENKRIMRELGELMFHLSLFVRVRPLCSLLQKITPPLLILSPLPPPTTTTTTRHPHARRCPRARAQEESQHGPLPPRRRRRRSSPRKEVGVARPGRAAPRLAAPPGRAGRRKVRRRGEAGQAHHD